MVLKIFVQADEPDKQALLAVFDNISLLRQHQNIILSNPQYYNIHVQGSGVFALYIPTFTLRLGELLLLWEQTDWKQGEDYFYNITGSPLSGSNSSGYWNKEKGFCYRNTPSFSKQMRSAMSVRRTGSPVYQQGPTPIDTPQCSVSDISIFELIDKLKQI